MLGLLLLQLQTLVQWPHLQLLPSPVLTAPAPLLAAAPLVALPDGPPDAAHLDAPPLVAPPAAAPPVAPLAAPLDAPLVAPPAAVPLAAPPAAAPLAPPPAAPAALTQTQRIEAELTAWIKQVKTHLKVSDLKELCRANSLMVSGCKNELLFRVMKCRYHGSPGACPACRNGKLEFDYGGLEHILATPVSVRCKHMIGQGNFCR